MTAPHSLHLSSELIANLYKRNCGKTLRYYGSTPENRDEVADLFLHLRLRRDRFQNLLPQQGAEALPQPVNGNVNGSHADASFGRQFCSRSGGLFAGKESLQLLEVIAFPLRGTLAAQSAHGPLQNGEGPAPFKHLFRCQTVGRLQRVARLGFRPIPGEERATASPALGLRAFPFVGQEILQRGQKEGAEAP